MISEPQFGTKILSVKLSFRGGTSVLGSAGIIICRPRFFSHARIAAHGATVQMGYCGNGKICNGLDDAVLLQAERNLYKCNGPDAVSPKAERNIDMCDGPDAVSPKAERNIDICDGPSPKE